MDEVSRLAAIEGIRKTKARYVRGADTFDFDLFGSAFTEDAVWDLRDFLIARDPRTGEWNGIGSEVSLAMLEDISNLIPWPAVGRAAISNLAREATRNLVGCFHSVFNPEIEVISDDSATATWPFEEVLHFRDMPIKYQNARSLYHEVYQKIGDEWLIKNCRLTCLLCTVR